MSDDEERYSRDDLRSLCFAAAEHFDHIALASRRASRGADSAALRFQMMGRSHMAEQAANYMRAVGNHQHDDG